MGLSSANDIRLNGSTVSLVKLNGQVIWPIIEDDPYILVVFTSQNDTTGASYPSMPSMNSSYYTRECIVNGDGDGTYTTRVILKDGFNFTGMMRFNDYSNKYGLLSIEKMSTKVTDMNGMFSSCSALTSLDVSNFDTSNVTNMSYMFSSCNALHTLRLDNCSNDTISKIITSSGFPTTAITGQTRTIYCKESEAAGLTAPTNWVFSYV